jgi:hypothetical protein
MEQNNPESERRDGFVRNSFGTVLLSSLLLGGVPSLVYVLTFLIYAWATEPQVGMLFGGPPSPGSALFWVIAGVTTLFGALVGCVFSPVLFVVVRVKPLRKARRIALCLSVVVVVVLTIVILEAKTTPPLYLAFLFSVLCVCICLVVARMMPTRVKTGYCKKCGYNLKGNVSGVCPECGWMVNRKYR